MGNRCKLGVQALEKQRPLGISSQGPLKCFKGNLSEVPISIPSVAYGGNVDQVRAIIDAVNHAVISDPYSPKIPVALQPDSTRRSGNLHQSLDSLNNSAGRG